MSYLKKRIRAFRAAGKGIADMCRHEAHARIHLFATACVIACGCWFRIAPWQWCAVILCIGGVLAAEAFNTAIERLADKVTREKDPLIGAAKDLAAGAVLLMAATSLAVGLIVFLPPILALFQP